MRILVHGVTLGRATGDVALVVQCVIAILSPAGFCALSVGTTLTAHSTARLALVVRSIVRVTRAARRRVPYHTAVVGITVAIGGSATRAGCFGGRASGCLAASTATACALTDAATARALTRVAARALTGAATACALTDAAARALAGVLRIGGRFEGPECKHRRDRQNGCKSHGEGDRLRSS